MKLTTVGTGTGAPSATRVCAGHLVESGSVHLLLDCGNGVLHRMAELGIRWNDITHVAITHFHADHIADLPMLIFAWRWGQLPPRTAPVTLIGPPGFLTVLQNLGAAFGSWVLDAGFPLLIRELEPGSQLALDEHLLLANFAVPHTATSVAYSVRTGDKRLVYTGDTPFDLPFAEWAHGCDVLLTECSLPDEMAIPEHLTPRQCGALAAIVQPARLVLTHIYPPLESVDIPAQVAEHFSGNVAVATDGFSIEL
ncbi:MAG: ribonuclease Z [Phycisphaerae bacterium]|nr:ribonuclease Z [Gemmatimonadaceae bacterium]